MKLSALVLLVLVALTFAEDTQLVKETGHGEF
jgi:hypothetical protein